jgi:60S ribosome subunit biogenesis protein NIP7
MRPLTEQETKTLFTKLASYTGRSLSNLITNSQPLPASSSSSSSKKAHKKSATTTEGADGAEAAAAAAIAAARGAAGGGGGGGGEDRYVFRLHNSRVYYVRLSIANLATSVARTNLLALGTCLGKFTRTGKFRLHITALDVLAAHARFRVWLRASGEMPFLYGGHVVKAHVGRWSEDCPEHQGVVVYSMDDKPLVSFLFFSPFFPFLFSERREGELRLWRWRRMGSEGLCCFLGLSGGLFKKRQKGNVKKAMDWILSGEWKY